jgi:hypothetical protein
MARRTFAGALPWPTEGPRGATEEFDMRDMKGAAPLAGLLLIAVILLASPATVGAAQLIA